MLEAYAAALECGADACEIDIDMTGDSVPVCFHDGNLERQTYGYGGIMSHSYSNLLSFGLRKYGRCTEKSNIPTFSAALEFARRNNLLLWLDIKNPAAEKPVSDLLDKADAWDHIIGCESYNSESIRKNPKLQRIQCKRWLFDEHDVDWDPAEVKKSIPPAGKAIMVNDPRLAIHLMGRKPGRRIPIPEALYQEWEYRELEPEHPEYHPGTAAYARYLGVDPNSASDLLKLLRTDLSTRSRVETDSDLQKQRAERLQARGWAAYRLGILGVKTSETVSWLEYQVKHRTIDLNEHGLDARTAALALGELGATESVPVIIERFNQKPGADLDLLPKQKDFDPREMDTWLQYDMVRALGKLPCKAAKDFLISYVGSPGEMEQWKADPAAEALAKQDLSPDELTWLLQNPHPEVRAAMLRRCLDRPTPTDRAALKAAAPWALELPAVGR